MPGKEKAKKELHRSNPLGDDIHAERFASAKSASRRAADENDADQAGYLIPNHTTKRILRTAKKQLEAIQGEVTAEENATAVCGEDYRDNGLQDLIDNEEMTTEGREHRYEVEAAADDEDVVLEYDDNESIASEMPVDVPDVSPEMYGIDEEEARLLNAFQPASRVQTRNLADMIMEKIREKEQGAHRGATPSPSDNARAVDGDSEDKIDNRVARVYTAIGTVLKRYTSGKIPKAFKILPNVKNWEQLLMLTRPDQWSPHATYQATRIFAANLNESMLQRFYAAVLLPIVHERLLEEKKLHPALYMAVRKALFKPVAFFKGFLLPLAMDEECTLREALVVASVLQRCHLPPVPTAVTIYKIAQQPFSGRCSVFLRVLIDKKMALPYQAIDELVKYFHRFLETHTKEEALPVLWHQTLLSFIQHYKADLAEAQLGLLSNVCNVHFHYMITPEIRREIGAALRMKQGAAPVS
ncbi:putative bystin [Leishmania infantum JPCM5]|uniref:Bystin_-_putative n=2 Tax=Leishmania infantum TaxID=5671 RepID=A0A6L0XJ98_LEIIN|nr:putative bystin [Leishmania infantum JPCM5]CAC9512007.1 bystin_-_putative [Leishmania infantum]CAM69944.1 putative bystin [Leishmania infantum JPCM5]SUZ43862.1 bystin_-_putative [Leishmania infantum]|eukprot:XP_001466895.1 putative bystin [Leishmania infantum JPCM5]